ncbi:MAG TPA: PKD domain-containing protein [Saprospiraceae bacterium]|nr:PKD domain-containing protein [Saprospiraceae bacterium]
MRKLFYLIPVVAIAIFISFQLFDGDAPPKVKKLSKAERIDGAIEHKKFTSSDVDSGEIPFDKLFEAIREGKRRIAEASPGRSLGGSLAEAVFRERGPNNIGGRTRAIHIDLSDPSRNTIWVGGVSGGLWVSNDITQADPQWQKRGTYFENIAIGDIGQDPVNTDVFYVGTGESYTGTGGTGIFKSTDHGITWTLLPSTTSGNFAYVNDVYVHTNGEVYASTATNGIARSTDGGQTWERVLGAGLSGANDDNFHDFIYTEGNQYFYTSNSNSVFKSTTGNRGDWTNIGTTMPGFPDFLTRVELAVCPSDPETIYVFGGIGGAASDVFISYNGGEDWITRASPTVPPYDQCGNEIGCGQAGYDLDIGVDPNNCNYIAVGGITLWESSIQGVTWQKPIQETQTIGGYHHDQHTILFDPLKPGRIYYGNDGGLYFSSNGGQSAVNKNLGYVTTQYYCGAIHPDRGSHYILGGTQDNGSHKISEAGLAPAEKVGFGDGAFCFIDQDNPNIQIISSQNGNYELSTNGGQSFFGGAGVEGSFINVSGYDDTANLLYGQTFAQGTGDVDFFRWSVTNLSVDYVDITNYNINVSAVRVDPLEPNRIYFGGQGGLVLRVDNANTGTSKTASVFADLPVNTSVSSIYKDKLDPDHALISLFSYGSSLENVYVTYNDGAEWTAIEGDLPDMPVNWAIFDPSDHDKVMIATEAGVWVTDDVNGNNTHWEPINPDNGMPFVDVDMLVMRESDKVVLAATYGRGLMTTDVFAIPTAVIIAQPIAYVGQSVSIDGSQSVLAQNYKWSFGDNTTSTNPSVSHIYESPGVYEIKLEINNSVTDSTTITILPYLPVPYQLGDSGYTGDFETSPEHFASYTVQGTGIQRGSSTKPGKDGTFSGTSAWVLGINDNLYQNNTRAEFYTPMYDLSEPGLYELKFWSKFAIQNPHDGFQVEYSTNGGASWIQLGTRDNPNWYNYYNANLADGAFPMGKSYFTNAQLTWTQYIKDISFLTGSTTVSFRYIFRSDDEEQAQGFAIDNFEITRYEGELETNVTVFDAGYTGEQEVTVNWATGIEYQCQEFRLERSYTGFGFTEVANIPAKGIVSTFANTYSTTDQSLRDIIYYRLKVINDNPDIGYHLEFYTDTIVVIKDAEPNIVHNVLPNPFDDFIGISFSSVITKPVTFRMYDVSGKLVLEKTEVPNAVAYQLDQLNLPTGVYVLSVQIDGGEQKAYKLVTEVK